MNIELDPRFQLAFATAESLLSAKQQWLLVKARLFSEIHFMDVLGDDVMENSDLHEEKPFKYLPELKKASTLRNKMALTIFQSGSDGASLQLTDNLIN